jgi:hypothetical protein
MLGQSGPFFKYGNDRVNFDVIFPAMFWSVTYF